MGITPGRGAGAGRNGDIGFPNEFPEGRGGSGPSVVRRFPWGGVPQAGLLFQGRGA